MPSQKPSPASNRQPLAGVDYYIDPASGLLVFTAHYLQKRGYCCGNGCRHCPYQTPEKHQNDASSTI